MGLAPRLAQCSTFKYSDAQYKPACETVSIGVSKLRAEVCLAHHVLRGPPLVGLSRQSRLLNEKDVGGNILHDVGSLQTQAVTKLPMQQDLLEELMSLRFWDSSSDRLGASACGGSCTDDM